MIAKVRFCVGEIVHTNVVLVKCAYNTRNDRFINESKILAIEVISIILKNAIRCNGKFVQNMEYIDAYIPHMATGVTNANVEIAFCLRFPTPEKKQKFMSAIKK